KLTVEQSASHATAPSKETELAAVPPCMGDVLAIAGLRPDGCLRLRVRERMDRRQRRFLIGRRSDDRGRGSRWRRLGLCRWLDGRYFFAAAADARGDRLLGG